MISKFRDSRNLQYPGIVIREVRLEEEIFRRFQVHPDVPERLVVASKDGRIYNVNVRDGACRLICDIHEENPKLSITNDGQHVV